MREVVHELPVVLQKRERQHAPEHRKHADDDQHDLGNGVRRPAGGTVRQNEPFYAGAGKLTRRDHARGTCQTRATGVLKNDQTKRSPSTPSGATIAAAWAGGFSSMAVSMKVRWRTGSDAITRNATCQASV